MYVLKKLVATFFLCGLIEKGGNKLMGNYINLVVPSAIKNSLLRRNLKIKVHYYSLEEVYEILTYSFDDNDIFLYAFNNNLSYSDSMNKLEALKNYYSKEESFFDDKITAINNGYLHSDLIKQSLLKKFPTYILGYNKKENIGFKKLLTDNNVQYKFIDIPTLNSLLHLNLEYSNEKITVRKYDEVFVECMSILNSIAIKIKKESFSSDDYLICCPVDYMKTLIPTANLYNLNLRFNNTKSLNIKDVQNILSKFLGNLDQDILKDEYNRLNESNRRDDYFFAFKNLIDAHIKILPSFNQISSLIKNDEKNLSFFKKLLNEYYTLKLQKSYSKEKDREGINIVTSINDLYICKNVYILGYSASLLSPSSDKDLIIDSNKYNKSYELTASDKDFNKIDGFSTLLKLMNNNVSISYASIDPLTDYKEVEFDIENVSRSKLGTKLLPDNTNDNSIYYSISKNNSAEYLYASIFEERYIKTLYKDPLFVNLIKDKKLNTISNISTLKTDKSKSYYIPGTYDNQFKCKNSTYFNSFFDEGIGMKNKATISHSSFDTYLNNPFDYYCKYYLKIKKPMDSLRKALTMGLGNLAHDYVENGCPSNYDSKSFIDNELKDVPEFQKASIKYFLERELSNVKSYIKPCIDDLRGDINQTENLTGKYSQIILDGDNKEFEAIVPINSIDPNKKPFYIQVKLDGIFIEREEKEIKNCFIVDYKTNENASNYYKNSTCIFGRLQQLPLYALTFNYIKDKYPNELSNTNLIGAFIMPIYSKETCIKFGKTKISDNLINKSLMNGFCLNEKEYKNMSILKEYASVGNNYIKTNGTIIGNKTKPSANEETLLYTSYHYSELSNNGYDVSNLMINPTLKFSLENNKDKTLNDPSVARYALLNVCALELFLTVSKIREGRFEIYPAYKKKDSLGNGDYKEVSYETLNQRHILSNGKCLSFNDFDYESEEEKEKAIIDAINSEDENNFENDND